MLQIFFTFFVVGLLISGISIPLIKRRIPINNWYGVRLPNTMKDKDSWYETNYRAGKLLFILGLIISLVSSVFCFIISVDAVTYSIIMSLITLVGTIVLMVKSIMIANNITKQNKVQAVEEKDKMNPQNINS